MTICSVCGGQAFGPGYGGRLAPNGSAPSCLGCRSTERHRIIHAMYLALAPLTRRLRGLQFAPDMTMLAENFKSLTFSTYNGENSMDMMATGLEAASFDLVASNHVLEHVKDHFLAVREMIRVAGPKGLVHVCVPSPSFVPRTIDWGYADPARTYHYRSYGADAGRILGQAMPGLHVIAAAGRDPVTDTYDLVYWLSQSEDSLLDVTARLQKAQFAVVSIQ